MVETESGEATTTRSISVIVTVRNAEAYMNDLIGRLEALCRLDREIVVVDDGSSDGSLPALRGFADREPTVLLIVNEANLGVAASRNIALKKSRGEFVWFTDADDAWEPDILDRLHLALLNGGADISICRASLSADLVGKARIIDGIDASAVLNRSDIWALIQRGHVHGYLWNKLFRRSVLGADPFALLGSQSDFTGMVAAVSRSSLIATIPDVLYRHVIRQGSITRSPNPNLGNLERCFRILADCLAEDDQFVANAALLTYFKVWFYCIPAADTPARVGSRLSVVMDGARLARRELESTRIWSLRRFSLSVCLRAGAIKYLGGVYPLMTILMRRALGVMRKS